MDAALLDTDILSEVLKQRHPVVARNAANYLQFHGRFSVSIVTRFEIVRGYKEKLAVRQLERFDVFCNHSRVLLATAAIFERAAELWASARRGGHPHGDADMLIAATALEHQLSLVTGNRPHFDWIPGITVVDWRQP
jgi:tRNA(fMet)-specific endonuclease VapC